MTAVTESAELRELRAAITMGIELARLMPIQKTVGAGYVVQADTVVTLPVETWDRIVRASEAEAST